MAHPRTPTAVIFLFCHVTFSEGEWLRIRAAHSALLYIQLASIFTHVPTLARGVHDKDGRIRCAENIIGGERRWSFTYVSPSRLYDNSRTI